MKGRNLSKFVQYGISTALAAKADRAGLTVSKARALSQKDMLSRYGLSVDEAKAIATAVRRAVIHPDTLQVILERSNFLCCVCKGEKGAAYMIHHIVEYEKTQNNSYANLAVLCPTDHDLAHRGGLTLRLSAGQIRKAKASWEKQVEVANAQRAAQKIDVSDNAIDYVNVKRIEELCVRLFKKIPQTTLMHSLKAVGILKNDGSFDQKYVYKNLSGGRYLFDYSTHQETEHYKQLLQQIAKVTDFVDLDAAISARRSRLKEAEGRYAFFIGGVCAKGPTMPITTATPAIVMHYSRKKVRVEWILDPMFLMSMSAIARIGGKNRYIIYCLVRTVDIQRGESVLVRASPLLIAQPTTYVDKTPAVRYKTKRHI
jgi:hypothetical protein